MEDNGNRYVGTREYMTPEMVHVAARILREEFRRRDWKPTGELHIVVTCGGIRSVSVTQTFNGLDVLPEATRL